ncbi:hypothetical protein J437_LFUL010152 [Ladona fulva]|uniref:Uncharacterized protein n=1 Tax=Ladona fulva TaxID=123851 RepID=A0A8K0K7A6_LADFU|nr:hypothetical protein J437_LFUL010152 [Ladona fulva]
MPSPVCSDQLGRQDRCICARLFSACVTRREGIVNQATALSYSQVSRRLKDFKEGREEVIEEPRAGRPSTSTPDDNLDRVRNLLNSDCRLSVPLNVETLNIPKTIAHELVTDKLDVSKVCAKLIPKLLTDDQKNHRVTVATDLERPKPL